MASNDSLPRWRQELLAVPENELCFSQKALLRGLELWDFLEDLYITKNPPLLTLNGDILTSELVNHIGAEDAIRSVLYLLEMEHLRVFRSNGIFSLLPQKSIDKVLGGVVRVSIEWTNVVHPLLPGILKDEDLLSAACELCMHRFNCYRGTSLDGAGLQMVAALDIFKSVVDFPVYNNIYAAFGSKLTNFEMQNLAREISVLLLVQADSQSHRTRPKTVEMIEQYFEFLAEGKIDWFSYTRHHNLLSDMNGLSDKSNLYRKIVPGFHGTAKRYLKAAEKLTPYDPHFVGTFAYELASVVVVNHGGWNYTEVEELVEKGNAGWKGCKLWTPKVLRTASFDWCMSMMDNVMEGARRKYPGNYREHRKLFTAEALNTVMLEKLQNSRTRKKDEYMHKCNSCGIESRDTSCCSGCKKTWYCNRRCQVAHWKAGHKAECGKNAATGAKKEEAGSAKKGEGSSSSSKQKK